MIVEISYRVNGSKCCVACNDMVFLGTVCRLCKGFDITNIERGEYFNSVYICVTKIDDGQYQIINGALCIKMNMADAFGYVIRTVLDILSQENENIFFLHGACVQYAGKYHCFIGRTKAGKSTIAYLMCQKTGCKYVTDDLICIDKSLRCVSFAKPIFLRNTNYIDDIKSFITIQYQDDLRYCVMPTDLIDKEKYFKIDNVFMIERDPTSFFMAKKLSGASAFVDIWRNMYSNDFLVQKRNISLLLAKCATVYLIKYRDVSYDIQNMVDLME